MTSSKRRKVLSVLLAGAMVTGMGAIGLTDNNIATISASAAILTAADGFSYEVIDGTNTVRIKGYSKNGKITIPSKIDGKAVVEIGNYAFDGKTGLQSVTIPSSVKTIGYCAFSGCTGLQSVTMNNGLVTIGYEAFKDCSALKGVTIPDTVTTIGANWRYGAFQNCTSLSKVTLGSSVEKLYDYTFSGCESLTKIVLPNSLAEMGQRVFSGCKSLETVVMQGENTFTIPKCAFSGCTSLENINIGAGITTISDYAFEDCTDLQSVTIPSSVKTMGYCTFSGCTSLKNVNIGAGITTVSGYVFEDCTALEEITIPSSVKKIESRAFEDCTALKKIIIPESVTLISYDTFYNHSNNLVIYGYSNNCEAKKYADFFNIPYKLIVSDPLANKSTISATNVKTGTAITVNAKATGGTAPYKYYYYCKAPGSNKYIEMKTDVKATSRTTKPTVAGTYYYSVKIVDAKGNYKTKIFTVKVNKATTPLTNNSTITATNIKAGTAITLNAKATGGTAPYKYYYYCKAPNSNKYVSIKTDVKATSRTTKPTVKGTYYYSVKIVDAKGNYKTKIFTVTVK